jgi:hypothetical protein
MVSRIHVKVGTTVLEYEGEEEFIQSRFLDVLRQIVEMSPPSFASPVDSETTPKGKGATNGDSASTVAAKLKVDSGPSLVIAILFHATQFEGKQSLSRKEILARMQKASAFYKNSYGANLTGSIERLVKDGAVNEVGSSQYALSQRKLAEVGGSLVAS